MEKWPFFRAATAGLGKYHTGGYSRIGVYRVKRKQAANFGIFFTGLDGNKLYPSFLQYKNLQ